MNIWIFQIKIISYRNHFYLNLPWFGGVEEDRTPDPLRARQVLSQLSYDPNRRLENKLCGHLE